MSNRDAADMPEKGTPAFDALGWSTLKKIFPLVYKTAKNYLAILAMSCASERTFSTGGTTVTTQRTKLDPTKVHYLVYCKEIKLARPRLEDDEEKEMEEHFHNKENEEEN